MTQEDKKLLLTDLCGRLPYGVIVRHADSLIDSDGNDTGQFWYKRGYLCDVCKLDDMTTTIIESEGSDEEGYEHICDLEKTLPYLRPISSMTEEEAKEIAILYGIKDKDILSIKITDEYIDVVVDDGVCSTETRTIWYDEIISSIEIFDWLNAHHFDYRGLIGKGLALEAPKGMYMEEQQ